MRAVSFKPENRLAAQFRRPGGMLASEALEGADRRLDFMRDGVIAALDQKVEALAAIAAARDAAKAGAAYAFASEICGLSGTFGLKEFSEAADCLCRLLDGCRDEEGWASPRSRALITRQWQSVQVHIDSLRTLRRPELSSDVAARASVVEGLRRLAARAKGQSE